MEKKILQQKYRLFLPQYTEGTGWQKRLAAYKMYKNLSSFRIQLSEL